MWFLKKKDKGVIGKLTKEEESFFEFIKSSEHSIQNLRSRLGIMTFLFWRQVKTDRGIKPIQKIEVNRNGQLLLLEDENKEDWEEYKNILLREKIDNPDIFTMRKECYEEVANLQDESKIKMAMDYIDQRIKLTKTIFEKFVEKTVENEKQEPGDLN
jgi:hypothetical protein